MGKEYRGWRERRRHKGVLMPLTYITLESILLLLIIYIVSMSGMSLLTLGILILAIHYFITSCLPRYHRAIDRQKYIKDEKVPY
jgi:Flp pilus assembly protein TadB